LRLQRMITAQGAPVLITLGADQAVEKKHVIHHQDGQRDPGIAQIQGGGQRHRREHQERVLHHQPAVRGQDRTTSGHRTRSGHQDDGRFGGHSQFNDCRGGETAPDRGREPETQSVQESPAPRVPFVQFHETQAQNQTHAPDPQHQEPRNQHQKQVGAIETGDEGDGGQDDGIK